MKQNNFTQQTHFIGVLLSKVVYDLMLMLLSDVGNEGGRVNTELSIPEDKNNENEIFLYMFNSGIAKNLMRHGYIFHHYTDDDELYSTE